MAVHFIPEEPVLTIHADLLLRYGGRPGIRDRGLLESALAQPRMTAGRKKIRRTIFEKASAYGYHICSNHPFIDGNKRVAFVVMDVFFQKIGWEITASNRECSIEENADPSDFANQMPPAGIRMNDSLTRNSGLAVDHQYGERLAMVKIPFVWSENPSDFSFRS